MDDKFKVKLLGIINQHKPITEEEKAQILAAVQAVLEQQNDAPEKETADESNNNSPPD